MLEISLVVKQCIILCAVIVFVSYSAFIYLRYGILKSYSISYYSIPVDDRWLFQFFVWFMSATIIVAGDNLLFYISGVLLSIVGFTPTIKDKRMIFPHYFGAIGGIAMAFVSGIVYSGLWATSIVMVAGSVIIFLIKKKNCFYWIELLSFCLLLNVLVTCI